MGLTCGWTMGYTVFVFGVHSNFFFGIKPTFFNKINSLYFVLLGPCMSLSLLYLAFKALTCYGTCFSLILHPTFFHFDFQCFRSTLHDIYYDRNYLFQKANFVTTNQLFHLIFLTTATTKPMTETRVFIIKQLKKEKKKYLS